jgi:hypothetical protein
VVVLGNSRPSTTEMQHRLPPDSKNLQDVLMASWRRVLQIATVLPAARAVVSARALSPA